jgi:hypothetical protein
MQIISHVVDHMSNILRSMLSPFAFFEMSDEALRKQYCREVGKQDSVVDVLMRGTQAWGSMTEAEHVKRRQMVGGLMTKEFMSRLDQVLGKDMAVDMWFSTSAEDWEDYCEEVKRLFDQFVYCKSVQQDEERQV